MAVYLAHSDTWPRDMLGDVIMPGDLLVMPWGGGLCITEVKAIQDGRHVIYPESPKNPNKLKKLRIPDACLIYHGKPK